MIKKSCPQLKELDMENNELGPRAVEFLHTLRIDVSCCSFMCDRYGGEIHSH